MIIKVEFLIFFVSREKIQKNFAQLERDIQVWTIDGYSWTVWRGKNIPYEYLSWFTVAYTPSKCSVGFLF